ncbi:MAG: DUF3488 and transglutaminase-like domain-containing protein [Myxococcales bacterium]|nr:DUF3488 and transglutaminase-like domain-containing protein [Myxococcales bacterium]
MRFRAAHKLTSYLMVASAVGTLTVSGSLALGSLLAFTAAAVLSWFAESDAPGMRWLQRVDTPLKVLVLGFFSITVFGLVRAFPEPDLTSLLDLVLVLLAYKLLQRRTNRDYLQIYILAFLLVLASSWLAQSALFAVGFAVYVVALIWALILFHLRREIEDNYLVKHEAASAAQRVTAARVLDSRRVVGRAFFWATGVAALGVLAGATVVFALAPRIGIGFLSGGLRRQGSIVGFSDQVELGHHGVLSTDNQTVVLRVGMPRIAALASDEQRDTQIGGMYWRGTVYDTYQNGQWLRSQRSSTRTRVTHTMGRDGSRWTWITGPETPDDALSHRERLAGAERQDIQLMGLSHPVAFALDRAVAYELTEPPVGSFLTTLVEPRFSGEASLRSARAFPSGRTVPLPDFAGARYVAYSIDSLRRVRPGQAKTIDELPEGLLVPYLQVPEALRARVGPLVRGITARATTPAGRAQAIVDWLHANKQYSLELKRDTAYADPLEDFLIAQSAGHCEYFASAAAIMMRLAGLPTRYVNGFLGGEWNALTQHLTVRDNRAHSWIEVYFSGFGWTRMDATPVLSRPTRMGRVKQLLDSIESWWGQWVIEYDASRQMELARGLAKSLGLKKRQGPGLSLPRPSLRTVGGLSAAAALSYLLYRRLRRRRPRKEEAAAPPPRTAGHRLYERALRALAPLGLKREPAETPREFFERAASVCAAVRAPLGEITRAYEQARFAERPPTAAQLETLPAAVATLERVCREATARRQAA